MNNRRRPTLYETTLLERLLDQDFDGAAELKRQLPSLIVETISGQNDNYGSIALYVNDGNSASVLQRVPVEARAHDSDEVSIDALLHIVNGMLNELEFLKVDGTKILERPKVEDFQCSAIDS